MLKVDIFVNPKLLYTPTTRYFWDLHWFPVRFFRKEIKKSGIDIHFKSWRSFSYDKMGDIICFSSYFFFNHRRVPYPMKDATRHKHRMGPFKCLEELKKREKKIIWFDMWDGPEALADAVLDYVDKYYKKQLFKDLSLYKKEKIFRHHSGFYIRKYNTKTPDELISHSFRPPSNQNLSKLALSWNFAFHDYRHLGRSKLTYAIYKLNDYKMDLKFKPPRKINEYKLSARFSPRNFQRKKFIEFLKNRFPKDKIGMGFIPRKLYFEELHNTDAVLSPFGYGEPCFRDIEAFIAGSAMIKPDMDHIETWPDIYRDQETYISIPWEIEKWKDTIPEILDDHKLLYEVAKNGQEMYKKIWEKEGILKFVNHFKSLILDC